jgi:hypothetical protein
MDQGWMDQGWTEFCSVHPDLARAEDAMHSDGLGHLMDLKTMGRLLDGNIRDPDGVLPGLWMAEKLLKVRLRAGGLGRLLANPAQRAFEERRGQQNVVLKARQMGLTTWIAARFFLKTITQPGTLTVQVAHTREAAEAIFAMVHRMWSELPPDWRDGKLRRTKANSGQMVFGKIDSEFRVISAGEENAGRGLTIQNLHLSEVSRWPGDVQQTLAGLKAALVPGGEMTLESTPSGASGAFYQEWTQAAETGLVQHFFPWWMEPQYQAAPVADRTPEEIELAERHGLSREQLGFRRELARSFRGLRAQEYAEDPESCFRASGDGCFPADAIDRHMKRVRDPVEARRGGALHIWLPPSQGRSYLLGVDTAGGGSEGDYAAVQVIDRSSGLQCAELRERLAPLELARVAASLAREYGGAEIAVERNNHGAAVLAYLTSVERYDRLYERLGVAGWLTTAGNKPAMISGLGALLEEDRPGIFSRRLLAECRSFVSFSNGSTGAASGSHDDCLMAMAIAHSVRAETAGRRMKA